MKLTPLNIALACVLVWAVSEIQAEGTADFFGDMAYRSGGDIGRPGSFVQNYDQGSQKIVVFPDRLYFAGKHTDGDIKSDIR